MARNKDGNDEDSIRLLQLKLFCRFSVFKRFLCKDEIGFKAPVHKNDNIFFKCREHFS